MAGSFPAEWIHGSPNCGVQEVPIQIHAYDEDTFILRQSKCVDPPTPGNLGTSFEAPFMYLLFGTQKALLIDSGATQDAARFPIAAVVRRLINQRIASHGGPLPLAVCHTHSHEDHMAGDDQFLHETGLPPTAPNKVVGQRLSDIRRFFHINAWPEGQGRLDLGERILDILPIPGHEAHHIALYDHRARLLLTGDTLYPGLLFVQDLPAYRESVDRLARFIESNHLLIDHVLGAHIEMKNAPGKFFGYPHPFFQPNEHALQLEARHVTELRDAVALLTPTGTVRMVRKDDFIVFADPEGPIPAEDP